MAPPLRFGERPGSEPAPDLTKDFPQEYVVDHVRVLQRPEFPQCETLFAGIDHANPFGDGWFSFNGGGNGGIGPNTVDLSTAGERSLTGGYAQCPTLLSQDVGASRP